MVLREIHSASHQILKAEEKKKMLRSSNPQVECAEDASWRPIPLHGGNIMPACIRKFTEHQRKSEQFCFMQPSTALSPLSL